jgi:hypothetical protein
MRQIVGSCASIALWLLSSSVNAQEIRTAAPCSPVIDRTKGNVIVNFTGGCTTGIIPAQIHQIIDGILAGRTIPPELLERYERLSLQASPMQL